MAAVAAKSETLSEPPRRVRGTGHGRFFNVVDLVNRLETERRGGKQGCVADYLTRLDFVVLDEL